MILGMNLPHSRDGILYDTDDQVKISCNDCKGCQKCCENMDDTIIVDPYDIWQLTHKLKISGGGRVTFEVLISEDGPLELGNYDGIVLPHIKMVETSREDVGACPFLSNGRCSIHFCRPGMCRLYPLGRIFTQNDDKTEIGYIILDDKFGCTIRDTDYIKVSEWIGISDNRYTDFLSKWHQLKKQEISQVELLRVFYATPYGDDFFKEFDERVASLEEN